MNSSFITSRPGVGAEKLGPIQLCEPVLMGTTEISVCFCVCVFLINTLKLCIYTDAVLTMGSH